jgi:hypothetical protein
MQEKDLFKGITREHLVEAIKIINEEGYPPGRRSSQYDLVNFEITYPPKYVLSLAGYVRDKNFIRHDLFSGGENSAAFKYLRNHGFKVVPKSETETLGKANENQGVSRKYLAEADNIPERPDFFNEHDFENLNKYVGQTVDRTNPAMEKVYLELKESYKKVEYWAKEIHKQNLPEGTIKIFQKPSNQANKFEYYLWAKLYPTFETYEWKKLAYTISISTEEDFCIKIDTVGLGENDPIRKKYLSELGEFRNSPLVKLFNRKTILNQDWEYLLSKSAEAINSLKGKYGSLLAEFMSKDQMIEEPKGNSLDKQALHPLNSILYGPPGTGKTYHSISHAVSIIERCTLAELGDDRNSVRTRFDNYVKEGKIVFATFHQSMNYEDFIEGIKPKTQDNSVVYEIEDGIFKNLCNRARFVNGNFDRVIEKLKTDISEPDGKEPIRITSQATTFDLIYRGTNVFYIQPLNSKKENPWYPINIENIRKAFQTSNYTGIYNPTYVREVISYLVKKYGLVNGNKASNGKKDNYVLIIDEINRGNVSQIFGELITLIESDKREGSAEQVNLMLPYSKLLFSVPDNLFIVGTMNTADRSVEALDTALRRRFSFIEMLPDYGLKELQFSIADVQLSSLLKTINRRLEKLLSKDHLIGHSYFMNVTSVEELKGAFQYKIVPLLQEYFYGDIGKIGLVLGEAFFETPETISSVNFFSSFGDYEVAELLERPVYRLKNITEMTDATFLHALQNLVGN